MAESIADAIEEETEEEDRFRGCVHYQMKHNIGWRFKHVAVGNGRVYLLTHRGIVAFDYATSEELYAIRVPINETIKDTDGDDLNFVNFQAVAVNGAADGLLYAKLHNDENDTTEIWVWINARLWPYLLWISLIMFRCARCLMGKSAFGKSRFLWYRTLKAT